jgi:hypothetical protein
MVFDGNEWAEAEGERRAKELDQWNSLAEDHCCLSWENEELRNALIQVGREYSAARSSVYFQMTDPSLTHPERAQHQVRYEELNKRVLEIEDVLKRTDNSLLTKYPSRARAPGAVQ